MSTQFSKGVLAFATKAHQGQKRKDGKDYITHPIAVAATVEQSFRDIPGCAQLALTPDLLDDLQSIAYLHDVIEDCDATADDLLGHLVSELGMEAARAHRIVQCVAQLTRLSKADGILEYLKAMSLPARVVKLSDLRHNMSTLEPGNQRDKYQLCEWFLLHTDAAR